MKPSDIRIKEISYGYEDYLYRTPIKFGGVALDRVTILNVGVVVESRNGRIARGSGSMPMGNVWSFPSKNLSYPQTLEAMKRVVEVVCEIYREFPSDGHPIDITHSVEHDILSSADGLSKTLNLADPIPTLATLVCASPFDAALHDAFGRSLNLNCYSTYSAEHMSYDLGHYLGERYRGKWLTDFVTPKARPRMPLYHLVGALDPLTAGDLRQPVADGLPETLAQWIPFNGLTHLKIKLNGDDLEWDVERVLGVDRVATEAQAARNVETWFYSLDFNEKCDHVSYLIDFLNRIREAAPKAFKRIQYIEQPTKRDLKSDRTNIMHQASAIRPVVIDESLIDQESLLIAKEMGYTGAALKACKGQTQSLLMAAVAQTEGMFLCVQDLTCPGASLIHSAGLAAHIPGVAAIESNARQYCPVANEPWVDRFPGMFQIADGTMQTSLLDGPGLGT